MKLEEHFKGAKLFYTQNFINYLMENPDGIEIPIIKLNSFFKNSSSYRTECIDKLIELEVIERTPYFSSYSNNNEIKKSKRYKLYNIELFNLPVISEEEYFIKEETKNENIEGNLVRINYKGMGEEQFLITDEIKKTIKEVIKELKEFFGEDIPEDLYLREMKQHSIEVPIAWYYFNKYINHKKVNSLYGK